MAVEKLQIVDALKNEGLDENLAEGLSFENEEQMNGWIGKAKNFASFKPEMLDKLTPEQILEMANKRQSKSLQSLIDSIKTNEKKKLEDDWKKNHKEEKTKPEPSQDNDMAALKKRLEDMESWKEQVEKEKSERELNQSIETKKKSVMSALKEDGCDNEEVIEFVSLKLQINKDSDIDELKKEGKKIYDDKYKKLYGRSYNPSYGGNGDVHDGKPSKEAQAILKKNAERVKSLKY